MKFTGSIAALIAAAAAKQKSGAMLLANTSAECRRELPSFALELRDQNVWEWWTEVQAEYAASDAEFVALFEEWQNARWELEQKYVDKWTEFISREHTLDTKVMHDVCGYVANNAYVNGIKLAMIVPELEVYMVENYSPVGDDLVTRFGLQHLNLAEGANSEVVFDFTIHEDEINDILAIRYDQWEEATEMMEAYERNFYAALDQAWNEYVDDTMETVQQEAALHREVVQATVDYLWDGSAYPGASLDDVYPRPSVQFAAKNVKMQAAPQDNTKMYAGGIAAGLAFTGMALFGLKKSQKEIVQPETLL